MAAFKTAKQMERHFKGISNHYRIKILLLIADQPGISLEQIVENLQANEKTIGEHTRRLVVAGLIDKSYRGKFREHALSPYGKKLALFIKSFQTD
jgi:DNA-binding transcriptional ArsR family regulator